MPRLTTLLMAIPLVAYSQPDSDGWTTATAESRRLMDQGRYAAALPAADAALTMAANPRQLAISLNNLLSLHTLLGRYEEAERFGRKALTVAEALDPTNRASIWHNTAHLYKSTGRFRQAEGHFRKALEVLESAPDMDVRWLATVRLGLGGALQSQNRLAEAEQSLTRSIQEAREAKADGLLSVATTSLGELCVARNRLAEAEALFLEAIATRERVSEPEHPLLAQPLYQLALIRFAQRRYGEADSFCSRSIAVVERSVSPNHPELLFAVELYSKILRAQNRKPEAKEWAKRAEALKEMEPNWQRHTVNVNALTGGR